MCRLVGVVASEPTRFSLLLREAPRSLAALSREHGDGWGVAVHAHREARWRVHRGIETAHADGRFHEVAQAEEGGTLVAHVRKRTVGAVGLENTHPFQDGAWVFAHNGTIEDLAWLRERASPARLAGVRGATDSELFFAYLLTRFDAAGVTHEPASDRTDAALASALADARGHAGGAVTFLLSDGRTLYARRLGRTLYRLERRPGDPVRTVRADEQLGVGYGTGWTPRRHAVLVASEAATPEPWSEFADGELIRVDHDPIGWRALSY